MRPLLALAGCLAMAACSDLPDSGDAGDSGGSVLVYAAHVERLRATGEAFQIPRACRSACTVYLAVPSACVDPAGWMGFHETDGGGVFNGLLALHYRSDRAEWFLAPGGPGSSSEIVRVPNSALIASGEARACP